MNRAVEQVRDLEMFRKKIWGEFERGVKELADASRKALGELQTSVPTTAVEVRPSPDSSGGIKEVDRELLTYAAAARRNVPAAHTRVVARGDARRRQVLIDRDPKAAGDGIHNLSERELVKKATNALDNMGEDGADAPDGGVIFRSARRLKNGGVIFEMNTVAAASWFREPDDIPVSFPSMTAGIVLPKATSTRSSSNLCLLILTPPVNTKYERLKLMQRSRSEPFRRRDGSNRSIVDAPFKQSHTSSCRSAPPTTQIPPYVMV